MSVKLRKLAAIVYSWAAATQPANDPVSGTFINAYHYEKGILHGVFVSQEGDYQDSLAMNSVGNTEDSTKNCAKIPASIVEIESIVASDGLKPTSAICFGKNSRKPRKLLHVNQPVIVDPITFSESRDSHFRTPKKMESSPFKVTFSSFSASHKALELLPLPIFPLPSHFPYTSCFKAIDKHVTYGMILTPLWNFWEPKSCFEIQSILDMSGMCMAPFVQSVSKPGLFLRMDLPSDDSGNPTEHLTVPEKETHSLEIIFKLKLLFFWAGLLDIYHLSLPNYMKTTSCSKAHDICVSDGMALSITIPSAISGPSPPTRVLFGGVINASENLTLSGNSILQKPANLKPRYFEIDLASLSVSPGALLPLPSCLESKPWNEEEIAPESSTMPEMGTHPIHMPYNPDPRSSKFLHPSFLSALAVKYMLLTVSKYSKPKSCIGGIVVANQMSSFSVVCFNGVTSMLEGFLHIGSPFQMRQSHKRRYDKLVLVSLLLAWHETNNLSFQLYYVLKDKDIFVANGSRSYDMSFSDQGKFSQNGALTWGGLFFFINFLLLLAMTKEIAKRFFHPYFLKKIRLCSSHYDRWLVYLLLLPTFSYVAAVGHESNEQDKSFVEDKSNYKGHFLSQKHGRYDSLSNNKKESSGHAFFDTRDGHQKHVSFHTKDLEVTTSFFHAKPHEGTRPVDSVASSMRVLTSTSIGGTVISDTVTWTSDHSPVLVEGMLDIGLGGILVIDAGTTVVFQNPSSGINVKSGGQLLIRGDLKNRVILKPSEQIESWNGITFEAGSAAGVFNNDMNFISGSVIQYTDIVRAGYSSSNKYSYGLTLKEGVCPYLLGVDMIDCGGNYYGSAIYVQKLSGILVARNLWIKKSNHTGTGNPQYALSVAGNNNNDGQAILENVNFDHNVRSYSLYATGVNLVNVTRSSFSRQVYMSYLTDAFAQGCTFLNKLTLSYIGYYTSGVVVVTHNSVFNGIDMSYLRSSALTSVVANNVIKNGRLYYYSSYSASITISDNIVDGSSNGGLFMYTSSGSSSTLNNTFKSCSSTSSPVIQLRSSLNKLSFRNNKIIESKGNYIFHLEVSSLLSAQSDFSGNIAAGNIGTVAVVLFSSYPWANFTRNIFENNTSPFSVETSMPSYNGILKVPANFWGLFQPDIVDLRQTVADGFVRSSQPVVDFDPVLSGPSIESDYVRVQLPGLFRSDGSIGGIIGSNESLMLFNSEYIANASILIVDGGSLTIGANTTITFAVGRGIIVKGNGHLTIDGPAVLKSSSNLWGGIILETFNNTIIINAIIKGSSVGVQVKSSGNLVLLYSVLREISSHGVWLDSTSTPGQNITLSNVHIDGPGGSGLYTSNFAGTLTLSNSTITDAYPYGVYVYSWYSTPRIVLLDNSINSTRASSTAFYLYGYPLNATILGNQVACSYQCLYLYGSGETFVDGNIFSGVQGLSYTSQQVYINFDVGSGASSFSLARNAFTNWKTTGDALYVDIEHHVGGWGAIVLSSNRFFNISAGTVFELNFRSSNNPTNIANIFETGLQATSSSCPSALCITNWPKSCGGGLCTLIGNIFNFSAPEGQYHLAVSETVDAVSMIDASLSYWGTPDESNLTEAILDGQDDVLLTTVVYLPYLMTDDSKGETSPNTTSLGFLRPGSILTGVLVEGENFTLDDAGSPYITYGSLIIDGFLEILPNVTIKMDKGSSVLIRRGNLRAIGSVDKPITFENQSDRWAGLMIEKKISVSASFKLLVAYSSEKSFSVGKDEFNSLFANSASRSLVRFCPLCSGSHRIIFYKRTSNITSYDAYDAMTCNFTSIDHTLNSNFELYGTLEDFLAGSNKWNYCWFVSGYGFPGQCGATYRTYSQSSEFLPTCTSSVYSYQKEVYWFLYDAESQGEKYGLDWFPTEISGTTFGLPFLFTNEEGVELEHVRISGAGSNNWYSLTVKRPSVVPLRSISVFNGMGNGVSIQGRGLFFFTDLSIASSTSSSGNGISVTEKANVSINGLLLSTAHTGYALYAYGDQVSVSLLHCHIEPKSHSQTAIYASYIDSIGIEDFVYSYDTVNGNLQNSHPIELYYVTKSVSVKHSIINCTSLRSYVYGIRLYDWYSYDANMAIHNVSFPAKSVIGGFVNIGTGGSVTFEDNNLFGGRTVYDAISIDSNKLVVARNVISNVTSQRSLFVVIGKSNVNATNNSIALITAQDSIIEVDGASIEFKANNFVNVTGNAAIEIGSNVHHITLTHNALIEGAVQYYVKTVLLYDYSTEGILSLGPNFWSTTSFFELNKATYDSTYDAALVTIKFESLFIDSEMTQMILSPPSQAILDLEKRTIGGTISDGATVVVPRGLYYAAGSITLRHPEAQLVLEPGVRIIFAQYASIRVDRGVLKVLGEMDDRVLLAPTRNLTVEYGDTDIDNSTVFDGIYFGPKSNGTTFGAGNQYIDGSVLRHCSLIVGGYFKGSASIYLDRVSVMLEKVSITGDWSRSVYGVYANDIPNQIVFYGISVQNAGRDGAYIGYVDGGIVLSDIDIQGCRNNGLTIYYSRTTDIQKSKFNGNGGDQVYVYLGYGDGDFNMTSCSVSNSTNRGVYIYQPYYYDSFSSVKESNFSETKRPLYIESRKIDIAFNRFERNLCGADNNCATVQIFAYQSLNCYANLVEDNAASQVMNIYGYNNNYLTIDIVGNIFRSNVVPASTSGSNAILAMRGSFSINGNAEIIWQIHSNEFSNLASRYEMSTVAVTTPNNSAFKINATNNYFTLSDGSNISSSLLDDRLFDNDEGLYPEIIFEPYLTKDITIVCPSNCTENGVCVFPGLCICKDGWSGKSCEIPTCRTLNFCSGNGKCSDFEQCTCNKDWEGFSCSIANCTLRNNCSGKGFCPVPNVCSCYTGYSGQNCSECAPNYRQIERQCIPCPICENGGTCNTGATCDCPVNYAGRTCALCSEGFFGFACQPLPFITRTIPSDAIDLGGVVVRVMGYNFGSTNSSIECDFGYIGRVNAELISEKELKCSTPAVILSGKGSLSTYLRVVVDAQVSYNSAPFSFYGVCPENKCEQGFCSFGKCVCYYGYKGNNCNETVVAPMIVDPMAAFQIIEQESFSYQLELQQGSLPVEWSLVGLPIEGMTINASSGLLSWSSPVAKSTYYRMGVQATNDLTRTSIELQFNVLPSYYVDVSTEKLSYVRPSPSLFIDIVTRDATSLKPIGEKIAVAWVYEQGLSSGQRRKVTVKTNVLGRFRASYHPYSTDAGLFFYGGEHPTYNNLTVQGQFNIMGIDISPTYLFVSGYPSETQMLENAFSLKFKGGAFSGINITFDNVTGIEIKPSLSSRTANLIDNTVFMSLEITCHAAIKGRVFFTLLTDEGISVSSAYVYLDMRYRAPKIAVSPTNFYINALSGDGPSYYDVVLQNIGSKHSSIIEVVGAFDGAIKPMTEYISSLSVNEATLVSFQVLVPEGVPVGTSYHGTIGFSSNSSDTAVLDYHIIVVPSVPAVLTVVTQNEATYFSAEKPNLDYVDVRVRSLTLGTVFRDNSGPNGTIIFRDLMEDFYEVTALKSRHGTFRKTIFLKAPGLTLEAFLEFEAVSYVFSVVQIPVTDKYEIIVEATFTTQVPKPVIIWDPLYLDWDAINSNLIESIQLTATNKGLIATDNLTFTLPDYWQNTAFIATEKRNLGRLQANSTISFPVELKQIIRYAVPSDRVELRDESNPNTVLFIPAVNDTDRWEAGPDYIMIDGDDPAKQWFYKFNSDGAIVFSYSYSDRTRYDYVYNGTIVNGTEIPVDVIVTSGTNLTGLRKLLEIPLPIERMEDKTVRKQNGRKLVSVENPGDCLIAAACIICDVFLEKMKESKGKRDLISSRSGPASSKPRGRDLYGAPAARAAIRVAGAAVRLTIKVCDTIKKYTEVGKFGFSVGIPLPDPVSTICDFVDPCKWFCPKPTELGGCTEYDCNGPRKICLKIDVPNTGDCSINMNTSPGPAPPTTSISPNPTGFNGCPRCGWYGTWGISLPDPCAQSTGSRRFLKQSGIIPPHVIPFHRSLINGCQECSSSDLKVAFREVDNRQSTLQEAETLLSSCIIYDQSPKSVFSCVIRRTWEIIDMIPLLSNVIECQLDREVCYENSDLMNNPGLANLFIQAKRFQAFINFVLLPYGGRIPGDPLTLLSPLSNKPFNGTLSSKFSDALVQALADNSDGGEFISAAELNTLLMGSAMPRDEDIAHFAMMWNHSLSLWKEGIFSASQLAPNFTQPFFDLSQLDDTMSSFSLSRSSILNENFAGFGDAWLTAVEGQQLEEAKQLAGVCASVRVRIEQELTLTRIGFEATLEIWNDGDFPLENVTVTLRASPFGNASRDSTSLFVFGEPELTSINSINGGEISSKANAKATWLILPLSDAAPKFDTKYQIGGVLRYSIEGVWYTQGLASDTITVKPDPQLYLKYFHSRDVFSDDPLSEEIEQPVPFHLGLLIENRGYGDAYNVQIVSSQPKIVENEKGLLVNFTIIGSTVNGAVTTSKSLNIDFGTVPSRSNTVGVWDMISSLRGKFNNFTATFQYKGPINDDRLSLIESVDIFELAHIVRVDGNHPKAAELGYIDDGVGDFLVNINPDASYIPDHVFTSDNRQSNFTVASVVDKSKPVSVNKTSDSEMVVVVHHNMTPEEMSLLTDWVYIRFDDVLADSGLVLDSVTRVDDNYTLIPSFNSWQTKWNEHLFSGQVEKYNFIHLFDFGVGPEYHLIYRRPKTAMNLKIIGSTESSLTIGWDKPQDAVASYIIFKHTNLEDQYYKIAKSYLPPDITTFKVESLSSGTSYNIQVIPFGKERRENISSTVMGTTLGVSMCGNLLIDMGEECDEGEQNGQSGSGCNEQCLFPINVLNPQPTKSPHGVPTYSPSKACNMNTSKVKIQSTTGNQIQFFEFQVLSSGTNIALQGHATQSSDFGPKFQASKAIDGINSTFSHTKDANAFWEVDLGETFGIDAIVIVNRYCGSNSDDPNECLCRLSGAKLTLLDEQHSIMAEETIGSTCNKLIVSVSFTSCFHVSKSPSMLPTTSPTASPTVSPTIPCYSSARRVRIQSTTGENLQFFEFQVLSSGTNIALQGHATQSSDFGTKFLASKAIDGINSTFSHTKDANASWEVDLGETFGIDAVVIVNRYCGSNPDDPNECLCRLSGAKLTLLDDHHSIMAEETIGSACDKLIVSIPFTSCFHVSKNPSMLPTTSPTASPTASPTIPCYSSARRVRIESTTGENLQFFEFQVLSSGTNIALQGHATQSSDFGPKFLASKAIDGLNSTFSHTKDANAFWEVDLGETFDIDAVVIVNRYCGSIPDGPNACLCRLSRAYLMLLDSESLTLAARTIGDTCSQHFVFVSSLCW